MKKVYLVCLLLCFSFVTVQCAGRIPSTKSAHSLTTRFFKNYVKKFPNTVISQSFISSISVHKVIQQSRRFAEIQSILTFDNGQTALVLLTVKNTPPFGWKVSSWELLQLR